jgi:hypothetical protein
MNFLAIFLYEQIKNHAKILIPLFFFFLSFMLKAQVFTIKKEYKEQVDSKKGTWALGLESNFARYINGFVKPPITFYFPTFAIKASYNPINKLGLGVEYAHQPIWGTFVTKTQHFSHIGAFMRYDFLCRKNALYIELSQHISNITWDSTGFNRKFPVYYSGIGIGARVKILPNVYVNYLRAIQFNTKKLDASRLNGGRIGLSVYFNRREKDLPFQITNIKMDRTSKFLFSFTGSYIHFDDSEFVGEYDWVDNTTRLGFYQSSFLSFGTYGRFAIGHSRIPSTKNSFFYFIGPFINAKFFSLKKLNYFTEIAYLKSNFTLLSGGVTNEFPVDGNATYFSITTGLSYRINPDIAIELGINRSNKVNNIKEGAYGAGGYRIGIERTFKLKPRSEIKSF